MIVGGKRKTCSQECLTKHKSKSQIEYDYVKKYFAEKGCTLLSDKYINNRTKLEFCGKIASVCFTKFKDRYTRCNNFDCMQNRSKISNIKKYGVDNSFKNPEIKNKIQKTIKEKYGDKFYEIIKDKSKKTNMEKYGCEYSSQSQIVKNKVKDTNLKKYGTITPMQNPEIQNKIKQTIKKRYGVEWASQNKFRDKIKQECLEKHGVEYNLLRKEVQQKRAKTCIEKYGTEYPVS